MRALFERPEGCTVREYAEAVGITRQAASLRLQRFVTEGVLVAADVTTKLDADDLGAKTLRTPRGRHVYRIKK